MKKTKYAFACKPPMLPTYVEYGAADIGIVGKDTLLEEGGICTSPQPGFRILQNVHSQTKELPATRITLQFQGSQQNTPK